jgi:tryptophan synthase alpha chain
MLGCFFGFIYVVSRTGVTGAGGDDQSPLERSGEQIAMLRGVTQLPLAVGFGVSTVAQVRTIAGLADGIIVGSGLVAVYSAGAASPAEAADRVRLFVEPLIAAMRSSAARSTTATATTTVAAA